ncbi:MAG: hypothetical protein NC131_15610 [Roseburia sp.]|nr:hypothetical protein [Roseburia sp.]
MIIREVNEYFLRAKVPIPYPSVLIESKNVEALPVLLGALEPGDVSIIFEYGGKFNVPKQKISHSAITLAKLLQVYPFTLLKSEGVRYEIRNPVDILEAGEWSD